MCLASKMTNAIKCELCMYEMGSKMNVRLMAKCKLYEIQKAYSFTVQELYMYAVWRYFSHQTAVTRLNDFGTFSTSSAVVVN